MRDLWKVRLFSRRNYPNEDSIWTNAIKLRFGAFWTHFCILRLLQLTFLHQMCSKTTFWRHCSTFRLLKVIFCVQCRNYRICILVFNATAKTAKIHFWWSLVALKVLFNTQILTEKLSENGEDSQKWLLVRLQRLLLDWGNKFLRFLINTQSVLLFIQSPRKEINSTNKRFQKVTKVKNNPINDSWWKGWHRWYEKQFDSFCVSGCYSQLGVRNMLISSTQMRLRPIIGCELQKWCFHADFDGKKKRTLHLQQLSGNSARTVHRKWIMQVMQVKIVLKSLFLIICWLIVNFVQNSSKNHSIDWK